VTVNISSPNTKNLRELQQDTALDALLGRLKGAQSRLADRHGRYVPLALKIAPDLEDSQIQAIADLLRQHRMDGVIATNTTLSRAAVEGLANAEQAGGLSGAPLRTMSNAVVKKLSLALAGEVPIIGVGGILCGADAAEPSRSRCQPGAVLHGLHLPRPGTGRRGRCSDRRAAPCLTVHGVVGKVVECTCWPGDNRGAPDPFAPAQRSWLLRHPGS
jgi:hypothetical protein